MGVELDTMTQTAKNPLRWRVMTLGVCYLLGRLVRALEVLLASFFGRFYLLSLLCSLVTLLVAGGVTGCLWQQAASQEANRETRGAHEGGAGGETPKIHQQGSQPTWKPGDRTGVDERQSVGGSQVNPVAGTELKSNTGGP